MELRIHHLNKHAQAIIRYAIVFVIAFFSKVDRTFAQDSTSFFEQFKYCVVLLERISTDLKTGKPKYSPCGTAFWVRSLKNLDYLVTNRHVFASYDSLVVRAYSGSSIESPMGLLKLRDNKGNRLWATHPDTLVDIAVAPTDSIKALNKQTMVKTTSVQQSLFAAETEIIEGDEVFVLGFPLGIRTELNAFPIVRSGTVALKPTNDLLIWGKVILGKKIYLLDLHSLGGNSGSPVFLKPVFVRPFLKSDTIDFSHSIETKLIGIVSGHVSEKKNIFGLPDTVYTKENAGLAVVHPASQIREVIQILENSGMSK